MKIKVFMIIEKELTHIGEKKIISSKDGLQTLKSESVVVGHEGFSNWIQEQGVNLSGGHNGLQGSYVCSTWDEKRLRLENDLFSMFPVIYFSEPDIFVASDSLYVLAKCKRSLNIETSHTTSLYSARKSMDARLQHVLFQY